KALDLLRKREYEEVADLSEVGRVSGLLLETFEQLHGQALEADVGFHRELLPHAARALAGGLGAQGFALEEQNVHVAFGQLVGQRATHDPAARNDYISAFHDLPPRASRPRRAGSTPCPTPRRPVSAR